MRSSLYNIVTASFKRKVAVICLIVTLALVFGSCAASPKSDTQNKPSEGVQNEAREQADEPNQSGVVVEDSVISWANMEVDNQELNLTDEQKAVLQYFDQDYFQIDEYDNLQKYPKAFRNAQVKVPVIIEKIITADDDTFECVASMPTDYDSTPTFYDGMFDDDSGKVSNKYLTLEGKDLLYLTGKQGEARLTAGECLLVYGRYHDVQDYELDGTSYQLPYVSVNYTQKTNLSDLIGLDMVGRADLFSSSYGETVAKAFFGNDIKLKEVELYADPPPKALIVTPDNQSNANFSNFLVGLDSPYISPMNDWTVPFEGTIEPDYWNNEEQRQINMSSDFKHYILSVYSSNLKKFYLEWYDRDFNKIWSREFDNVDQIPYDYTKNEIYLVADNDLYIIDTATGEDKISPTMVGEKISVNISTDGTYLIGTGKKDNVMKVDATGQILWKTSSDSVGAMQIVNKNIVIGSFGAYSVIDTEGNVILSFQDAYPENNAEDIE